MGKKFEYDYRRAIRYGKERTMTRVRTYNEMEWPEHLKKDAITQCLYTYRCFVRGLYRVRKGMVKLTI